MEKEEKPPAVSQYGDGDQDCFHLSTKAAPSVPCRLQEGVTSSLQHRQRTEVSADVKSEENNSQDPEKDSDEEFANCFVYFQAAAEKVQTFHEGGQVWAVMNKPVDGMSKSVTQDVKRKGHDAQVAEKSGGIPAPNMLGTSGGIPPLPSFYSSKIVPGTGLVSGSHPDFGISSVLSAMTETSITPMTNITSTPTCVTPMTGVGGNLPPQGLTPQNNSATPLQWGSQPWVSSPAPWFCQPLTSFGGVSGSSTSVISLPGVVTQDVTSVTGAVTSSICSVAALPVTNTAATLVNNLAVAPASNTLVTPVNSVAVTSVSNTAVTSVGNITVTPVGIVTPGSSMPATFLSNQTATATHANCTTRSMMLAPCVVSGAMSNMIALAPLVNASNSAHNHTTVSQAAADINRMRPLKPLLSNKTSTQKIAPKPDSNGGSRNMTRLPRTLEEIMAVSSMCSLSSGLTNVQACVSDVAMSSSVLSTPCVSVATSSFPQQMVGIINSDNSVASVPQWVLCNLRPLTCVSSASSKAPTARKQKRRCKASSSPVPESRKHAKTSGRITSLTSELDASSILSSLEKRKRKPCSVPSDCCSSKTVVKSKANVRKHLRAEHNNSIHRQKVGEKLRVKSVTSHDAWKCLICDKVLTSLTSLLAHRLTHSKRRYVCRECNAGFSLLSKLRIHQKSHTGVKNFSCEICQKRFSCSMSLKYHQTTAHADHASCKVCKKTLETGDALNRHSCILKDPACYVCDICKKTFEHEDLLTNHPCGRTGTFFECTVCNSSFETSDSLKNHSCEPAEGKRFACDKCDKTFKYVMSLNFHKKEHARLLKKRLRRSERNKACAKQSRTQGSHVCHICGKVLANRVSLQAHEVTHSDTKPFNCNMCQQGFNTRSQLQRHQHKHTGVKPYSCDKCLKTFTSLIGIRNHFRTIHLNHRPFACDVCSKSFSEKNVLEGHKKIHSNERPFGCEECGKTFKHAGTLKCHKLLHDDKRPFKCEKCGKAYITANSLAKHTRTHSEPKCVCDVCGKAYYFADQLNRHKEVHAAVKPSECSVCNKSFATERSLQKHQLTHSTKREFKCNVCDKEFRSHSGYYKHKVSHSNAKPYTCDVCQKAFKRSDSLRVHRKSHFDEKKFVCDQCGLAYHNENSLKMHQKLKHLDCEKLFVCKVCGKAYQFHSYLKEHERVHSNEKTLVCKICNKAVKYHLERHMKLHHGSVGPQRTKTA